MRAVLALFEGVCTGAADGYARMTGKPAMTLLHLGPGLANGLANLHNARRANSPIVNVIGDQATWHRAADAPLTSDIVSLASPMSGWVREVKSRERASGRHGRRDRCIAHASGQSRDADCAERLPMGSGGRCARSRAVARLATKVAGSTIDNIAKILRAKQPTTILLGGHALSLEGLKSAARVAAVSGCKLMTETFTARIERGAGIPNPARLPYFPEQALEALKGTQNLILAGAKSPVAFFGYQGLPSSLVPDGCTEETLARVEDDVAGALEALADASRSAEVSFDSSGKTSRASDR